MAGQDATEAFEDVGHSDEARETLEQLLVGTLKRQVRFLGFGHPTDPVPKTLTGDKCSPVIPPRKSLSSRTHPVQNPRAAAWASECTFSFSSVALPRLAHINTCNRSPNSSRHRRVDLGIDRRELTYGEGSQRISLSGGASSN